MLVHQISSKSAGINIVHADDGAKGKRRLVLKPTRGMPIFLAILDSEMILVDVCDSPTGDGAAKTGLVGYEVAVPRFICLKHCLGINLVVARKLYLLKISRRQATEFLHSVHHGIGAVLRQAAIVFCKQVFHLVRYLHKTFRVFDLYTVGAANRNGLEIL